MSCYQNHYFSPSSKDARVFFGTQEKNFTYKALLSTVKLNPTEKPKNKKRRKKRETSTQTYERRKCPSYSVNDRCHFRHVHMSSKQSKLIAFILKLFVIQFCAFYSNVTPSFVNGIKINSDKNRKMLSLHKKIRFINVRNDLETQFTHFSPILLNHYIFLCHLIVSILSVHYYQCYSERNHNSEIFE